MRTYMLALALVAAAMGSAMASAQTHEAIVVQSAAATIDEIMSIPVRRLPESLLSDSQAVAIVPNVVKGSFVIGIRHGRGVVVTRDTEGNWQLPILSR